MRARRVVIKLGTQVVMGDDGAPALPRLRRLAAAMAKSLQQGHELIVVSSGAVGLGRRELQRERGKGGPTELVDKQACAAAGQALLMATWRQLMAKHKRRVAQILVTAEDFADRARYLSLRATLEQLLAWGVLPVLNENDPISTQELGGAKGRSFGDNDKLSALVAGKLEAQLLCLLTDVDALYSANPKLNRDARRIVEITDFRELASIDVSGKSSAGRGGFATKLEAARLAAICGVDTFIGSGFVAGALDVLTEGLSEHGTFVRAHAPQDAVKGRKRWIATASGYAGILRLNAGARAALLERNASLLTVGVSGVEGNFLAGQVVSLQDDDGRELGRGLCYYGADDLRRLAGQRSEREAVHRDQLVIFKEYSHEQK